MITIGEGLALGGFALNAAAVIWGAARISTNVENLKEELVEFKKEVREDIKEINEALFRTNQVAHNASGELAVLKHISKISSIAANGPGL